MKSSLLWTSLVALALLGAACSDQNAPVDRAHPDGWVLAHGADSGARGSADGCRSCHGNDLAGGGVGVACLDCHMEGPPFFVHPANWANPVVSHQVFAETLSWTTCATAGCHGPDLRGGGPQPGETGPSCFRTLGCHPTPDGRPPRPHAANFFDPALHGPDARGLRDAADPESLEPRSGQFYCRNCHGRPPNTFDGGFVSDPGILGNVAGDCSVCHPAATAHPTNWQGTNGPRSHRATPDVAWAPGCGLCHNTLQEAPGAFPGAPSCFAPSFANALSGGVALGCHTDGPRSVPHAVDGTYFAPAAHGPDAKADLVSCQNCHGEAGGPGSNPRFNVGILSVGGQGCEACHNDGTAHPAPGTRENVRWFDGEFSHRDAERLDVACARCHGAVLEGGVGPACTDCHTVSPAANPTGCVSCHDLPPSGQAPAGDVYPNRAGQHRRFGHTTLIGSDCSVCHSTGGFGTAAHFDVSPPADIATPPVDPVVNTNIIFTLGDPGLGAPTTCNGSCHGFPHVSAAW